LQAASYEGREQVVKLLLEKNADVDAQGGRYGNALCAASYGGHKIIAKLLFDKDSDLEAKGTDVQGWNPLQLAARGGHLRIFQYLASMGISLSTLDAKKDGVLCYAASGGALDVLQAALDLGLTFPPESMHWSPLHWACRSGIPEVVELLINEG
ncbi:ankyrin, partial [Setomelanomma holmii]